MEVGAETKGVEGSARGEVPRAKGCAYYLAARHELIKRHVEIVDLNADKTARRQIQIDLELPTDPAALLDEEAEGEKHHFVFPLAYVHKADTRTGLEVRDENNVKLIVPIRSECDRISARAVAAASAALSQLGSATSMSVKDLEPILEPIVSNTPFEASLRMQEIFQLIGLAEDGTSALDATQIATGKAWEEAGLADTFHMLVEHALLWVPMYGRPGERRTVTLTQQITLERRSLIRWIFRDLATLKSHRLRPFRRRRVNDSKSVLEVGDKRYGRRSRRISFSVLAERIGQPIAWTPAEFEFPTIYVKRCLSYHFELRCPPARTPRDLRPAAGTPLAEPGKELLAESDKELAKSEKELPTGRTTLTSRAARHDLPDIKPAENMWSAEGLWFRVSIGIGDGAFPGLWFLFGAITAVMLWLLADHNPELTGTPAQIVAGIMLVVPALVAALVIGGDGIPVTQRIGGARLLFLITGLSAVGAAAVIAGAKPWGIERDWTWTACAIAATIATVPLGTSWLLSSPLAWSQLKKLKTWWLQISTLTGCVVLAAAGMVGLTLIGSESLVDAVLEGVIAVYLLVLTIGIMALANNRVAMEIGKSRGNVVISCLVAGLTCASLACIELRAAIDPGPGPEAVVEWVAIVLIASSLAAGYVKTWIFKWTAAKDDEIHVSPQAGKAMLAGESIRELMLLRNRECNASAPVAPTHQAPANLIKAIR